MKKMLNNFFLILIKSILHWIIAKYVVEVNNWHLWPVLKQTACTLPIERTARRTERVWTPPLALNCAAVSAGKTNSIYMGIDSNGIFVYMYISWSQIIRFAVECHTELREIKHLICSCCVAVVCWNKVDAMFPTSSQRRYWTFENEDEIAKLRIKHNQEFVTRHRYQLGLDVISSPTVVQWWTRNFIGFCCLQFQDEECLQYFLTPNEERMLLKNYELHLKEFCRRFDPPMPKCIVGTAFHYFKRFYLRNSPMDYHPKEIL